MLKKILDSRGTELFMYFVMGCIIYFDARIDNLVLNVMSGGLSVVAVDTWITRIAHRR